MKVIKRDGRAVDYEKSKIEIAIEKANNEVKGEEKASKEEIANIITYIEDLGKKRILVEDIQDIIEQKLMEIGKYNLAKKYIVYRYTRALVRKKNTTDESILGLIKNSSKDATNENSNKNAVVASTQRDLIAGEVSKDLTKRILLPEKISKANEEGILYFHDAEYFLQPIHNCTTINIKDMLDKGTVLNGKMIESPNGFRVACSVITEILAAISSNQYGEQCVNISHLGKYLRKSYDKFKKQVDEINIDKKISKESVEKTIATMLQSELSSGVQTLEYQINTLMATNGKTPPVTLFLSLDENSEYLKENSMIIEEILKQRIKGIKNEEGTYVTPEFPKLIYVLDEHNSLQGGKYDYLTKLAIKCSAKRKYPYYISAKKSRENYDGQVFIPMGTTHFPSLWKDENGKYKFEGRFNQGIVSINLPQIGIIAKNDENKFWELLDERLELCKEALMCKHYALLGTVTDVSPIHWMYGGISRLEKNEKIDKLLKNGYSTLSLGYVGIYELTKLLKGVSHSKDEGKTFALKVVKYLKNTVKKWKDETGLGFVLCSVSSEKECKRFAKIDKEKFGKIEDITDKDYYTGSYHVNEKEEMDIFEKLKFESEFHKLSNGGAISYIDISNIKNDEKALENIIEFIYNNVQFVGIM